MNGSSSQLLIWSSGTLGFWTFGRGRSRQIKLHRHIYQIAFAPFSGLWRGSQAQIWVWLKFFYSIQLSLRKFWFDSTHGSQWLYKNRFKSTHDSKWISEIWFKSTHDCKTFQNFDSNQLTIQNFSEFRFESTHDSMMLSIPSFVWHLLGIQLYCWLGMTFFGASHQVLTSYDLFGLFDLSDSAWRIDLNQLMTQAIPRGLE